MATKKTTSKKKKTKKVVAKAASKKAVSKKAPAKKAPAKKAPVKKAPAKKAVTKKPAAKKPTTKKAVTKKAVTKNPAAKKPASKKAPSKKPAAKKPTSKKKTTKKALSKADQEAAEMAASKKAAEKRIADAKAADAKKNSGRKGITIVDDKPKRRSSSHRPPKIMGPPPGSGLLTTKRKPLIASGPKAPESQHSNFNTVEEAKPQSRKKTKSPFNKKQLDKYREILLAKRQELVGDVATMEKGVLSLGDKGGDPATDVAEQGSDAYDQSLSIGFAEVDRKLIREIDDAIERIENKTFGLCQSTNEPISTKRLDELPWTNLSIQAARDIEHRGS